jgi:hypothetical protein
MHQRGPSLWSFSLLECYRRERKADFGEGHDGKAVGMKEAKRSATHEASALKGKKTRNKGETHQKWWQQQQ